MKRWPGIADYKIVVRPLTAAGIIDHCRGTAQREHLLFLMLALTLALTGCGGGTAPSPPTPDFSLSISPSSVSIGRGGIVTPL